MKRTFLSLLALSFGVVACGAAAAPQPTTRPAPPAATTSAKPDPLRQDVSLAVSSSAGSPTKHLPTIAITKREVRLLGDTSFAMPMPDATAWDRGMPATVKRNGPNDLFLVPLAGWLANVHDAHDVSIIADAAIPYRLLMEVLFTCAQSSLDVFHLVVSRDDAPAEIVVRAPHSDPNNFALPPMTLLVLADGVSIKMAGGNIAPSCKGIGPGLAVADKDGAIDQAALRGCIHALGAASPAPMTAAMVAANPGTPFSDLVAALDALRAEGASDVSFGLAR